MTDESKSPEAPETPGQPGVDPPQSSGSRWEPTRPTGDEPLTAQLSEPVSYDPVPGYSAPTATAPTPGDGRLRTRLGLAAAAVGLVALGGAGGYVLGHASAGSGTHDVSQQGGFPGAPGEGGRPDFDGDHHQHDHDHDGFGGPEDQTGQPGTDEGSGADT